MFGIPNIEQLRGNDKARNCDMKSGQFLSASPSVHGGDRQLDRNLFDSRHAHSRLECTGMRPAPPKASLANIVGKR